MVGKTSKGNVFVKTVWPTGPLGEPVLIRIYITSASRSAGEKRGPWLACVSKLDVYMLPSNSEVFPFRLQSQYLEFKVYK